jgi:hypothetical protein
MAYKSTKSIIKLNVLNLVHFSRNVASEITKGLNYKLKEIVHFPQLNITKRLTLYANCQVFFFLPKVFSRASARALTTFILLSQFQDLPNPTLHPQGPCSGFEVHHAIVLR